MSILVTTTNSIDGKTISRYLGVVRGIVVRSPTIAQGIMGGLKAIVGGKIGAYTEMCESSREEAYQLMIQHAQGLGATAILCMRYDATDLGQAGTEVLCYGTAVIL